ncbi:hypothetical protein M9H77_28072 [Catharanthus roseus]|uniref:Uncharacterized protein n=1 Tax=Catharanthus roseus TaxID=4058 RepID=A0ACC0AGI2_CATRO|nr:hypothetical protein M9H77_28072 [Catharanthus roseus]
MEGSSKKSLVFAYYVTGHGYGHATRAVEVVRNLILAGHYVHVVTVAPEYVFTIAIQSPQMFIRKVLLDSGAVQTDALTVDRHASLEKYFETAVVPRDAILETEISWLKSVNADLVVSDVVPVACRAAADAGIRSVCVTNFSWDFIYAQYVMAAGYHNRSIIWQIAEDYSHAELLIRLPGYCPMPAFRDVVDAPLVVRRLLKSRAEVRKELGIGDETKVLIYNFGGTPSGLKLKEDFLPAGWICLVCGASEGQELPQNFMRLPTEIYTPDLIAASDCMIGKIGYGTVSEALAYKVPFVFVRRDYFNEEPFLRHMLEHFQSGVEMIRRDLVTGQWAPYLKKAINMKPCYEGAVNGGEVAARILEDTAFGKSHASRELSGSRRLQDAIVLGYQLQGVQGRDMAVPEWYSLAPNEFGFSTTLPHNEMAKSSPLSEKNTGYVILHGDHHGLCDTIGFLKGLVELRALCDPGVDNTHHSRESLAAAALFNWEEEIFVARAPGRLDVMGGIADYSGSLVLQMPIREACHAAVQRNHPSKHKLWKHAQARQESAGKGPTPVLQIVSFGSELGNRGPTFDMDLSEFMDGDRPISYEKAQEYFARDMSQKWAAYVAGTVLVLMTELGVRFKDSISIVVSSGVPEGKGVSSSAAVEVASMSAIAAAHGLNISPRDLALLCQKVENRVVGAPCGVMDQMASACGEADKLLAMICQPAEVLGLVDIPAHIRFWGIDSGIRHSVGGADYGSVRVGAFMGKKILRSLASEQLSGSPSQNGQKSDIRDEDGRNLVETEASLDFLCNLSPHRYEASYVHRLPEILLGQEFIDKYVSHEDSVTVIDRNHSYAVKAPTQHPIYENFRVKAFSALLAASPSDYQFSALGELMYQCHYSYSQCGLGSDGTDRLVELVQEMRHGSSSKSEKEGTLFGAKITGGGSGGTVCVIGRNCVKSSEQILQIQQRYEAATGFLPYIFEGSSPGAGRFGYMRMRLTSN